MTRCADCVAWGLNEERVRPSLDTRSVTERSYGLPFSVRPRDDPGGTMAHPPAPPADGLALTYDASTAITITISRSIIPFRFHFVSPGTSRTPALLRSRGRPSCLLLARELHGGWMDGQTRHLFPRDGQGGERQPRGPARLHPQRGRKGSVDFRRAGQSVRTARVVPRGWGGGTAGSATANNMACW